MNAIAHVCEEEGKIVRVPVDVLDRAFAAGRVEEIDGTPVYSMITGPDRIAAFIVKRLVDVVVAGLALVVASPLLLLIALWIRLREGPPVLFRQTRVGLHGRRFEVLKFRTMSVDAEARYLELVDRVGPAGLQADGRSADHGNGSIPASDRPSTSCRSSGTCSRVRCPSSVRGRHRRARWRATTSGTADACR